MRPARTLYPSGAKIAAAGSLVWLFLLGGTFLDSFHLSVFEMLFLLAPWVAVPLALNLVPATSTSQLSQLSRMSELIVRYLLLPGALLVTPSFFLPVGWRAGALVGAWLIVGVALALHGLERLIRDGMRSFPEFCFAFGEGYALVGALWLLASRLGLQPIGFHEPIVLLTAIHFHYAGLMAAILAGLAASEIETVRTRLALRIALSCAVLGPGFLGLAFLTGPKMKLAAVGLMVIGEFGIALGTFCIGLSDARGFAGRMLLVGSSCVIFGMVLAGIWAVGEYPLHAFVDLEQMARYHGVLNSVGFGLCSLVGWTFLRRKSLPA
jgi:YndJ-like protein